MLRFRWISGSCASFGGHSLIAQGEPRSRLGAFHLVGRPKRTKFIQWALTYLAGAWVVLVLAWFHGEKGHQRISDA